MRQRFRVPPVSFRPAACRETLRGPRFSTDRLSFAAPLANRLDRGRQERAQRIHRESARTLRSECRNLSSDEACRGKEERVCSAIVENVRRISPALLTGPALASPRRVAKVFRGRDKARTIFARASVL